MTTDDDQRLPEPTNKQLDKCENPPTPAEGLALEDEQPTNTRLSLRRYLFLIVLPIAALLWVWRAYLIPAGWSLQEFWSLFMFLLTTLGITILSIFAHNRTRAERQHNRSKLSNECLAHSQLAYLPFYFGLISTITLPPRFVTTAIFLIVASLLAFYVGTAFLVDGQERVISTVHQCRKINNEPDPRCRLPWSVIRKFCLWNMITAVLAFTFAALAAGFVASLPRNK